METDLSKFLQILANGSTDFRKETLRFPHLGENSTETKVHIAGVIFYFNYKGEFKTTNKTLEN